MDPPPEGSVDRGAPPRASALPRVIDMAVALVLPVLITGGIFLAPFLRDATQMPFGADTFGYMWRAAAVQERGLEALDEVDRSLGARPLQPIIAAVFLATTGSSSLDWAIVSPAVMAATIALAAGAVAVDALGEPRRRALAYGVGVGASAFVAWTAFSYAANLTLDPMALALVLVTACVAFGTARRLAGVALLLGAALTHYLFAAVIVGLLFAFGLACAVGRRRLPGGGRPPDGAARRVFTMLGAGLAASLVGIGLSPQLPTRVPTIPIEGPFVQLKAATRLPQMALWATVPLAAVGGFLRIRGADALGRWATGLLLAWAALAPISMLGWFVLDLPSPPYRWAAFALPVPLLVVVAAASFGDPLRRRGTPTARLGAGTLLGLAAGALAVAGAGVWWTAESVLSREGFAELGTVANYARAIPSETPLVLVVRRSQPTETPDRILAALPPEVIERFSILPAAIDRDRPDLGIPAPEGSALLWVSSFGQPEPLPGVDLGPGVVLIDGPLPTEPFAPGPLPRAPPPGQLVLLATVALIALTLAGSGWAGLAWVPTLGRWALAPTFGLALLGSVGLVASRLGLPFTRSGAFVLLVVTSATGWAVDLGLRRWRAARPLGSPP